ncbi:MAG: phosphotransferase [Anaerolineae bacterium]|nr:phosphotransferase [Anaerolineae bacterium]
MITGQRIIGRGRTANIYTWSDGYVLKLFHDWMPLADIEAEAHHSRAVAAAGLAVPGVGDVIHVDGRHGLLYERVDGPTMFDVMVSRPWKIAALARQMADLHAAVHAVQIDDMPPLKDRLRWRIERVDCLPDNARRAALAALDDLPDGGAACHGDLHPDNILLTARGPVIIDWIAATRGNPLADVARTSLLLTVGLPPSDMGPLLRALVWLVRGIIHRAYLRRYLAQRGATLAQVNAWMLPVLAVRLSEHVPGEQAHLLARIRAAL